VKKRVIVEDVDKCSQRSVTGYSRASHATSGKRERTSSVDSETADSVHLGQLFLKIENEGWKVTCRKERIDTTVLLLVVAAYRCWSVVGWLAHEDWVSVTLSKPESYYVVLVVDWWLISNNCRLG